MIEEINKHIADLEKIKLKDNDELEKFRIKYISKKGIVPLLFSKLKEIPDAQKKEVGLKINSIKEKVNEILSKQKKKFTKTSLDQNLTI